MMLQGNRLVLKGVVEGEGFQQGNQLIAVRPDKAPGTAGKQSAVDAFAAERIAVVDIREFPAEQSAVTDRGHVRVGIAEIHIITGQDLGGTNPHLHHLSCAFVTEDQGRLDDEIPDPPAFVVVNVGAADAHRPDANQCLSRPW